MSGALDELTADEKALFDAMRAQDNSGPAPEAAPDKQPQRQQPESVETPEPQAKEPDQAKLVDKRALDEERTRRKKAEQTAREREVELAKVNTRFEMLTKALEANAAQPTPPVAETPVPAFDTDPKAWIDHNVRELQRKQEAFDRRLADFQAGNQQIVEQQRQQQQIAELQSWAQEQEQDYMQAMPDYNQAMAHLLAARQAHIRAIGEDDPVRIQQAIRADIINTAYFARQKGRNFAETLYKLAEASGYKPSNGGADNPLAPARTPTVNVDSAAERLLRGNDMATTLGSTGAAPRGELATQAIANMSDAEFEAVYAKILKLPPAQSKAAMRNLFGT